jgi:hypothetical protein
MASFANRTLHKILQIKIQILWIIAAILSVYFIYQVILNAVRPSHGFASHYTASKLLIEGEDVADFYDDDWFASKVEKYVPGVYEIYLVNMPTTALIFLPIANLDYQIARLIWIIFNLIILVIMFGLIIKRMKFGGIWLPVVLILFLTFQPLYANISYGQVYIFIFCLLVLAWFSYLSNNETLLGIIMGSIFIFKTSGPFLWILFAIQKKWKSLILIFATAIILFATTLPLVGLDSWSAYGNKLLNYTSSPTLSVTAYQTIHSFFHHFFVFDEQWNPEPLINLPLAGKVLAMIFTLLILVVTIIGAYKFKKSELAFGTFIIVGIILNPASIDYHFMLMLIPILILFNWLKNNPSLFLWAVFAISFLLVAASLPYISPKIIEGLWAVFAYPKLYGALGLWFLSLRVSYLSKSDASRLVI